MKIALIGANGQLGTDIYKYFNEKGLKVYGLMHIDIEVCDRETAGRVLGSIGPDLIINTAAFHNVDLCEDESSQAFRVNVLGVKNLAEICLKEDIPLMHFSTDYVFKGNKGAPYTEDDCPDPINIYGISKLAGERVINYILDKHYIIRVSGLYGHAGSSGKGGNFIELMIRLAGEGKDIKVVNDQVLTPTSTEDLAEKLYELVRTNKYGVYHMTNSGHCSWYEFAGEIFRLMGLSPEYEPVESKVFGAKANRPVFSAMDNKNLMTIGLKDMRHWKLALKDYIDSREL